MTEPKCPTCGITQSVTPRPATAIVRGVRHGLPSLPVLTPDEGGAVRASDGTILAYVTAEPPTERAAP